MTVQLPVKEMTKKCRIREFKELVSKPFFDEELLLNRDLSYPRVSVVTPSYNQGQFLERTILSVLNQNYPNLEYIIIDGGSTDRSVEIIRKYEKYLSYWISEKDQGQADAIYKGFEKSSGSILAWLNADDIYLPGTLLRAANILKDNSHADVVYGNIYLIDEAGEIIGERRLTRHIPSITKLGFLHGGFGIYQPASFWKRELYYKAGKIDPSFQHCMDNDLFVKFAVQNAKFEFVREFLTGFRVHSESKTSNLRETALKEQKHIFAKYGADKPVSVLYRNIVRTVKVGLYLVQGDGFWLARRLAGKYVMKDRIP